MPKPWPNAAKRDRPLALQRAPEHERVLGQLPNDGTHPLTELAFWPGGSLFANPGAVTDRGQNAQGALPPP